MNIEGKIKNLRHRLEAMKDNITYGFPSRKIKVIGITGTDGKTTTTSLVYHILKNAGKKVSMISTVYAKVGDEVFDTGLHVTTPHSSVVQRLLKQSVDAGDEYFVLETTSHAIDQHRVGGSHFQIGVITNITHEHLDYHKTYENYLRTKAKLLLNSSYSLINKDDGSYKQLKDILTARHKEFYTYGLEQEADFQMDIAEKLSIDLPHFNKYNYLAAYGVCSLLNIKEEDVFAAMKTFQSPTGRMETVHKGKFTVIVDFAHTPNAIKEALEAAQKSVKGKGRLIHVFGCAGLRDYLKRPMMGEMSGEYADITIITEEDYRTEDPEKITHQVAEGIEKKGFEFRDFNQEVIKTKVYMINNKREEAIKKALSIAKEGDVVILTGKGHEKSLARGKTEYPWSDQEAVKRILKD